MAPLLQLGLFLACSSIFTTCTGDHNTYHYSEARIERDYDYFGSGESYYLKALFTNETYIEDTYGLYRYVCWDQEWERFSHSDIFATILCEENDFTYGSPYTGTDHIGEVTYHVDCLKDAKTVEDCSEVALFEETCEYHVRIQCMDPLSYFAKNRTLLAGMIAGMCIFFTIAVVACCCMCCLRSKNKSTTTKTSSTPATPAQMGTTTTVQFVSQPARVGVPYPQAPYGNAPQPAPYPQEQYGNAPQPTMYPSPPAYDNSLGYQPPPGLQQTEKA